MPEVGWFQLLTAALGGGLTVKAVDILYQELRRRLEGARTAENFVDSHLDPILKAADELVGKLRAMAERDFRELRHLALNTETESLDSPDLSGLLFLFGKFWARVEIFRREGLSVAFGRDERGRRLQSFFDCLESRRVRIVDRITQRAIGEVVATGGNPLETITFIELVRVYERDKDVRRWLKPLCRTLLRTRHTSDRQRLLQYGVVVHALVDTLDPHHLVTRDRPSYPNKLSRRSWRDLRYRVFDRYLTFVPNPSKYLGPPK